MKLVSSYVSRVILILFALTACSTTQTQTSLYKEWSSDTYLASQSHINSVLIIGVTEKLENRRSLENKFVEGLSKIGVAAVPSIKIMSADTDISRENVEEAVEGRNIDAVLVTRLVRLEEAQFYHGLEPSSQWSEKEYYNSIKMYTGYAYGVVNNPNLVSTNLVALLKISLYDLKTEQLIWSVHSQSLDPESADEVIRSLTALVINRLREEDLM